MNRRKFLATAATAGGLVVLGGGFYARQAYARNQLRRELLRHSTPLLTNKAHDELRSLPTRAREEMRKYFHGVCLNVSGFVDEVCSPAFRDKLAVCPDRDAQHGLLLQVFMSEVVTELQVLERVRVITQEISSELDDNWASCCSDLADRWGVSIKKYQAVLTSNELMDQMTPIIRHGLHSALETAQRGGQRLLLSDVLQDLGESAMLMIPLAVRAPWMGWPLFAVLALKPLFTLFADRVMDRSASLQRTVSERLAYLGNRVGSTFEEEVKFRIADLHRWQDEAVESAAAQQVAELVPSFL